MDICPINPEDHAAFVRFLDAGMRPAATRTRAWEDFPVALGLDNTGGMYGIRDETGYCAGLVSLVRPCKTTVGTLLVAGIGSVVTRPDRRGEGLSSRLQRHVLDQARGAGVPLAVLWTDRPEIYAGRGFKAAGWEYHLDLDGLPVDDLWPAGADLVTLDAAAAPHLATLYQAQPCHTVRGMADHAALYGMPGTTIRGLALDGHVVAHACCGKGEDFPDYVAEWSGETDLALALLARIAADGLAHRALVPCGREDLLEWAVARGARYALIPSGQWAVLRADLLVATAGPAPAGREEDPTYWLGHLDRGGRPVAGPLRLGIWGLDSV